MIKNRNLIASFTFALTGVKEAIKSESNLRIHFVLALISIFLGLLLQLTHTEWAVLTITIFLVLTLELLNTVLEKIVDLVSPEIKEQARIAKDISAAVVLLGAIASVVVAAFLFLPKIIAFLINL